MTTDRLQEIKERAEKATGGPWGTRGNGGQICAQRTHVSSVTGEEMTVCDVVARIPDVSFSEKARDTAAFIAHSREDIDWLVQEVERLRAPHPRRAISTGANADATTIRQLAEEV